MTVKFRFAKIDVEYFDNPKIDPLSNEAKLLHLGLILRAARLKSDGVVTANAARAYGQEALDELLGVSLLIEDGKTYRIHDYLAYQTPKAYIEERSATRALVGAKGGHSKNHAKKYLYDDTCTFCLEDVANGASWLSHPNVTCKQDTRP